ncbi:hypothetical protein C8R47DRAFT_1165622 [Mycena vitilis]|nr:hypothetical protein C8R47DRAFT_1165622 [Mycena vitilis]
MDPAPAISQPSQDGFEFWGMPSSIAHGISDDSATDWDDSFGDESLDFVPSSQPSQDGEDSWYMTSTPPSSDLQASTSYVTHLFSLTERLEASHPATPLQAAQQNWSWPDVGALDARRPPLVRRASPVDIRDLATVGHHKIFQKLVNAAFFSKERKKRRSHYFDGLEALPRETFGLLMDAIVCGIDRWKTGEWEMVAFEAEVYRPIHRQSMIFIGKWIAEFDKDVYPENLAKARLREMLIKARKLSDVPAEPAKDRRSVFNMSLFS